jgi:hypothetical protein
VLRRRVALIACEEKRAGSSIYHIEQPYEVRHTAHGDAKTSSLFLFFLMLEGG